MLNRLIEQGYYLPALRILANSTPPLFKHSKILVEDSKYVHAYIIIACRYYYRPDIIINIDHFNNIYDSCIHVCV